MSLLSLTRETRIIRMERALNGRDLTEPQRQRAYRNAGIEAIEPGDDAEAARRAEIYRTQIAYGLGERPMSDNEMADYCVTAFAQFAIMKAAE